MNISTLIKRTVIDSVLSLKIKISVEYGRWDVKVYVYMVVELCEYESARR